MDSHDEDRIVAAFRTASINLIPGVSDRLELFHETANVLRWKRVTKDRREMMDVVYRLALHRKIWLRQSEGAQGPYAFANARPVERYSDEELQTLAQEAFTRTVAPTSHAEGATILARYLGFKGVSPDELAIMLVAVAKVMPATDDAK